VQTAQCRRCFDVIFIHGTGPESNLKTLSCMTTVLFLGTLILNLFAALTRLCAVSHFQTSCWNVSQLFLWKKCYFGFKNMPPYASKSTTNKWLQFLRNRICFNDMKCRGNYMNHSSYCPQRVLSRVRVSVVNNIGFWIGWLDLLTLIHVHSSKLQATVALSQFYTLSVHRCTRTSVLSLH
jgi:hypothetical protein